MSNKYTEGTANVLLHLHPHAEHPEQARPTGCPECGANEEDIITNDLPAHHIELTCRCLKCGCQWMPNSDD